MNILLWLDEDQLRDVVIFDPISYFVSPATIIISKLTPTKDDSTTHETEIHRQTRLLHREEYLEMTSKGIVADVLLPQLLIQYNDRIPKIVRLMVKYGLLVPIVSMMTSTSSSKGKESVDIHSTILPYVNEYIAPALLPDVDLNSPMLGKYNDIY